MYIIESFEGDIESSCSRFAWGKWVLLLGETKWFDWRKLRGFGCFYLVGREELGIGVVGYERMLGLIERLSGGYERMWCLIERLRDVYDRIPCLIERSRGDYDRMYVLDRAVSAIGKSGYRVE